MEETITYGFQNVDWTDTLIKAVLGILGIIVFAAWKVREHLWHFSFSILVQKNKPFWIWSLLMVFLVLSILTLSPETSGALKTMIGLDVSGEPASFLLLGWSLSALANSFGKKKIENKE